VAGFGRIVDLKPERFLTDISDAGALLEAEQGAIDHMNADHRDAMNLYATWLLGAEAATGIAPAATRMHGHAGRHKSAAAGFSAADCHPCRTAADAEGPRRSSPRCSKH